MTVRGEVFRFVYIFLFIFVGTVIPVISFCMSSYRFPGTYRRALFSSFLSLSFFFLSLSLYYFLQVDS